MATTKKLMGTTAVGGGALAIEDVFSTYLYTGNGSTQTITNGIDLAGEGGMVWIKVRDWSSGYHSIHDTERGATKRLTTNTTDAETTRSGAVTAFNSDGFSVGNFSYENYTGRAIASWTWRKAPRFFDCVTYTGDGTSNRAISHNLGSTVGSIFVKRTDTTGDWVVWHRSLDNSGSFYEELALNTTAAATAANGRFPTTEPTSTEFYVNQYSPVNASGGTYVAYLFAHDPLGPSGDGSDGLIACGSYTGNGSADGPEIDLGWEPQWLLVKESAGSSAAYIGWYMFDNMRGFTVSGSNDAYVRANESAAEDSGSDYLAVQPTGFKCVTTNALANESGGTYIYIAIRRGPMRQPTSGTEVFAVTDDSAYTTGEVVNAGFTVDTALSKATNSNSDPLIESRLTSRFLRTSQTNVESSGASEWDYQSGNAITPWTSGARHTIYQFKRAPGFFDAVAYTGTGSTTQTKKHNLGAVPEMIWSKRRDSIAQWGVYHKDIGYTDTLVLDNTSAVQSASAYWKATPIETEFYVGTGLGASGGTYIAYLFATVPGVSKVGSYTGSNNVGTQTINCGFTTGARFVLIKSITTTGEWYVFDSVRGITVGATDPLLYLQDTGTEYTESVWGGSDMIQPHASGFTLTTNGQLNNYNASYIFLAIA